ncbi:MAG: aspartate/glutamate racemase family protein [Patescibacteria group bacterium]
MIGLFDSGSGGLSVLSALRTRSPYADVAYFGDIKNAPYGVRSQEELAALTVAGVEILKRMGATEIVSACNSVSQSVLNGAVGNMPFVEMSAPTAALMRTYEGKRALLIATPATVDSGMYAKALENSVELDSLPITGLAGAIEFGATHDEIARIVRAAFQERKGKAYDCLILGCTHYPLVRDAIEDEARAVFGSLAVIDPAQPVAEEVSKKFNVAGEGKCVFKISAESDTFRRRVSGLFPEGGYTIEVI